MDWTLQTLQDKETGASAATTTARALIQWYSPRHKKADEERKLRLQPAKLESALRALGGADGSVCPSPSLPLSPGPYRDL